MNPIFKQATLRITPSSLHSSCNQLAISRVYRISTLEIFFQELRRLLFLFYTCRRSLHNLKVQLSLDAVASALYCDTFGKTIVSTNGRQIVQVLLFIFDDSTYCGA